MNTLLSTGPGRVYRDGSLGQANGDPCPPLWQTSSPGFCMQKNRKYGAVPLSVLQGRCQDPLTPAYVATGPGGAEIKCVPKPGLKKAALQRIREATEAVRLYHEAAPGSPAAQAAREAATAALAAAREAAARAKKAGLGKNCKQKCQRQARKARRALDAAQKAVEAAAGAATAPTESAAEVMQVQAQEAATVALDETTASREEDMAESTNNTWLYVGIGVAVLRVGYFAFVRK